MRHLAARTRANRGNDLAANGGEMVRKGPAALREVDRLREIDERLVAMGVDITLPWLPLTAQLNLFIPPDHPGEPQARPEAAGGFTNT